MTDYCTKQYAVLTSDIVHATKLEAKTYALVMKTLQKVAKRGMRVRTSVVWNV